MNTQTTLGPLTQVAIQCHAAATIAKQPGILDGLLEEAGLTQAAIDAISPLALATLALRMDGIQLLLRRWAARPPVTPEEAGAFFSMLDEAIADQTRAVADELLKQRDRPYAQTQSRLDMWNRHRNVAQQPSRLLERLESGELPPDNPKGDGAWERVPLPGGQFAVQLNIVEDPAEVATRERIQRERARKLENQS